MRPVHALSYLDMGKSLSRILIAGVIFVIVAALGFASYRYGLREAQNAERHSIAYIQTMLAFAQYKRHERIESLLLRKCYDAALAETQQLKNGQLSLIADNFRRAGNDADIVAQIKERDPKLMELVLAGRIPELKPLTTTCP